MSAAEKKQREREKAARKKASGGGPREENDEEVVVFGEGSDDEDEDDEFDGPDPRIAQVGEDEIASGSFLYAFDYAAGWCALPVPGAHMSCVPSLLIRRVCLRRLQLKDFIAGHSPEECAAELERLGGRDAIVCGAMVNLSASMGCRKKTGSMWHVP